MVSGLSQTHTESFGGKNLALCRIFPIKSRCICLISDFDAVQKRRIFFLLATLPSQKIVKEIAYILTSYQAPLKLCLLVIQLVSNEFLIESLKANKG